MPLLSRDFFLLLTALLSTCLLGATQNYVVASIITSATDDVVHVPTVATTEVPTTAPVTNARQTEPQAIITKDPTLLPTITESTKAPIKAPLITNTPTKDLTKAAMTDTPTTTPQLITKTSFPATEIQAVTTNNPTSAPKEATSKTAEATVEITWVQTRTPKEAQMTFTQTVIPKTESPGTTTDTPTSASQETTVKFPARAPSEGGTNAPTMKPLIATNFPTVTPQTILTHAPTTAITDDDGLPAPSITDVEIDTPTTPPLLPEGRNLDQFNYRQTVKNSENTDYGPDDWGRIRCLDKDICMGWPDSWKTALGWELNENSDQCEWCPADGTNTCSNHRQSPINLERNRAIVGHPQEYPCEDDHWMAYYDSSCSFEELQQKRAFSVERHALKISQPVKWDKRDEIGGWYKLDCWKQPDAGFRRWGRIDFSEGYGSWWFLSHIDVHVPSEHTQEGKRYAGELQMYHYYSNIDSKNDLASVTMFLEAYDDTPDWDIMNRIICAWRDEEEKTHESCGLPSVATEYPGCFRYTRGLNVTENYYLINAQERKRTRRHLRRNFRDNNNDLGNDMDIQMTAYDVLLENKEEHKQSTTHPSSHRIQLNADENFDNRKDFDWDTFIAEQYLEDERKKSRRRLMNYVHVPWFNYFPMLAVRTEYYYRYFGTQTTPPCYNSEVGSDSRRSSNNWRIMKDPILVSKRQINEMHRLLRERIAPKGDPLRGCQPDTAAKIEPNGNVDVARPLQETNSLHDQAFCECPNWTSKWKEDQKWCKIANQAKRFYEHPYNFEKAGF